MSEYMQITTEEYNHLKERLKRLANEKAELQLFHDAITRIEPAPTLQETAAHIVSMFMDTLGGSNIILFYLIDDFWYSVDVTGKESYLKTMDDPTVLKAIAAKSFIAERGGESKMNNHPGALDLFKNAGVWVFPLFFQGELIGAVKLEGVIVKNTPNITNSFQTITNYLALLIKDRVQGYTILQDAYTEIKAINTELLREVQIRKRTEIEKNKNLEELEHSNQELEQFAHVASHDLKEPLRGMSNFAMILEREYRETLDPTAQKYLDFIIAGAKRMQQLVDNLLEFTRIKSKAKELEAVKSERSLLHAESALKTIIEEKGVIISRGSLPEVLADDLQLSLLFQNLIGNAIKYCKETPPKVTIHAEQNRENWKFFVSDNGIGIDPKYSEQIFEIFQRLHSRKEYQGTGIGLAICRRIITRHRGKIWLELNPEERGSTFCFTLPIVE